MICTFHYSISKIFHQIFIAVLPKVESIISIYLIIFNYILNDAHFVKLILNINLTELLCHNMNARINLLKFRNAN